MVEAEAEAAVEVAAASRRSIRTIPDLTSPVVAAEVEGAAVVVAAAEAVARAAAVEARAVARAPRAACPAAGS